MSPPERVRRPDSATCGGGGKRPLICGFSSWSLPVTTPRFSVSCGMDRDHLAWRGYNHPCVHHASYGEMLELRHFVNFGFRRTHRCSRRGRSSAAQEASSDMSLESSLDATGDLSLGTRPQRRGEPRSAGTQARVQAPGSRPAHRASGFRAFTITDVATWSCCSDGSARRICSITSSVNERAAEASSLIDDEKEPYLRAVLVGC